MSAWSAVQNASAVVQLIAFGAGVSSLIWQTRQSSQSKCASNSALFDLLEREVKRSPEAKILLESFIDLDEEGKRLQAQRLPPARELVRWLMRPSEPTKEQLLMLAVLVTSFRTREEVIQNDITSSLKADHLIQMITKLSSKAPLSYHAKSHSTYPPCQDDNIRERSNTQFQYPRSRSNKANSCINRSCLCHCHAVVSAGSRRRRILSRPSLSALLTQCNCPIREYKCVLSLSRNILCISLLLNWVGGFSIQPTLKVPLRVRNTSPGFILLEKCESGIMSLDQARKELKQLFHTGKASIHDVDPSNQGWLEKLLACPWINRGDFVTQFGLLKTLVEEGLPLQSDFLPTILDDWNDECCLMLLLEAMTDLGADPYDFGTRMFLHPLYPQSHPYLLTNMDPFSLKSLLLFTTTDPYFGNLSKISLTILHKSVGMLQNDLKDLPDPKDVVTSNFLGQSLLHLAASKPRHLQCLLEFLRAHALESGVDLADNNKSTPIMYAAWTGNTEAVRILLESGADVFCKDERSGSSAVGYALMGHHVEVVKVILDHFLTIGATEHVQLIMVICIIHYAGHSLIPYLAKIVNVTFSTLQGNTFLHLVRDSRIAKALLTRDDYAMNQKNKRGYTPLMILSRLQDPSLISLCLNRGSYIHCQDNFGQSSMHHLVAASLGDTLSMSLTKVNAVSDWNKTLGCLAVLLHHGGNPNQGDGCYCPCSPIGCSPFRLLLGSNFGSRTGLDSELYTVPWLIEIYLLMIDIPAEHRTQSLHSLFRFVKFDELGMTHTCCSKRLDSWQIKFHGPLEEESLEEGSEDTKAAEVLRERREINREQKEYTIQLEGECKRYQKRRSISEEDQWLVLLARRAVYLEEATKARFPCNEYSQSIISKAEQPSTMEKDNPNIEILRDTLLPITINYENDTIGFSLDGLMDEIERWPSNMQSEREHQIALESCIDNYTETANNVQYESYNGEDSSSIKIVWFRQERARLADSLKEHVLKVRIAFRKQENDDFAWDLGI